MSVGKLDKVIRLSSQPSQYHLLEITTSDEHICIQISSVCPASSVCEVAAAIAGIAPSTSLARRK